MSVRAPTLFVSYSSKNGQEARSVAHQLESAGYLDVILAEHPDQGVRIGADWEQWIYVQLQRATAVIFLASEASLGSRWCTAELAIASTLDLPILTGDLEPLGDLPLFLARHQRLDLSTRDPGQLDRLVDGLAALGQRAMDSKPYQPDDAPYPGLHPFRSDQSGVFFGRSNEVAQIVRPMLQARSPVGISVIGPSGVGKSSVVQAGVLPTLRDAPGRWSALTFRAGAPMHAAFGGRSALGGRSPAAAGPSDDLAATLEEQMRREGASNALVVVEQAEQILIEPSATNRAALVSQLQGVRDRGLSMIFTLRSEFLGHEHAGELADLIDMTIPIGHLNRRGLREVITEPARRSGLTIAPALVERILDDTVRGDALPLLAFALRELWDRRDSAVITAETYELVGGVRGALVTQADDALALAAPDGPGSERHAAVMRDLRRLARLDGKHEAPVAASIVLSEAARDRLEPFIERGLVVTGSVDDSPVAMVGHEALLRQWQPLRKTIEQGRADLLARREFEILASNWDGHDPDALLYGDRLERAAELLGGTVHPDVDAYLAASRREDRKRSHRRRYVRGVVVLGVVAAVLAAFALVQQRRAEESAQLADAEATRSRALQLVAESARQRDTRLDLAALLAIEAATLDTTATTRGAVADALEAAPGPLVYRPSSAIAAETVGLTADGLLAGAAPGAALTFIDPRFGVAVDRASVPAIAIGHLESDVSTGRLIATGRDDTGPLMSVWESRSATPSVVRLASNPRHLAAGGGQVVWVDAENGVWRLDGARPARIDVSLDGAIEHVALSGDGACLALADPVGVRIVDVIGTCIDAGAMFENPDIRSLTFSPVETLVGLAVVDEVLLWSPGGAASPRSLGRHGPRIQVAQFSPNGTELVTGGFDGLMRTWSVDASGVETRPPLVGHASPVRRIRFGASSSELVSSENDGTTIGWTHRPQRQLLAERIPTSPSVGVVFDVFDSDGELVVVGTDGIEWGDVVAPVAMPLDAPVAVIGPAADRRVVVAAADEIVVTERDGTTVRLPSTLDVALFADNHVSDRVIAVTFGDDVCTVVLDDGEANCGRPVTNGAAGCGDISRITAAAVDPTGDFLALGNDLGTIAVVGLDDLSVLSCLAEIDRAGGSVTDLAWTTVGDSNVVVAGHDLDTLTVADHDGAPQLRLRWVLAGHTDSITSVRADGALVVSSGEDGRVMLWDLVTGRSWGSGLMYRATTPDVPQVDLGSVSLVDDRVVAVQDGDVVRWDIELSRWVDLLCGVIGRSLTEDELRRFQISDEAAETRCDRAI